MSPRDEGREAEMVIEQGIPRPGRYPGPVQASMFQRLNVGESFIVPDSEAKHWRSRTYYWEQRLKRKFSWRNQRTGFHRCWRMA